MQNRRFAVIAGLGVVELWIVGLIVRSVAGGGHGTEAVAGAMPVVLTTIVASDGMPQTIHTGPAPHVVIDDEDAVLDVSVQPGANVWVQDRTQHGKRRFIFEKTGDGVRIAGESGGLTIAFDPDSRHLAVVVPPQALLDVLNARTMTVTGLRAATTLHSDDGSVVVSDQRGELSVTTDNGRIALTDVSAPTLEAGSDDGRISLDRVSAGRVSITSDNGPIEAERSSFGAGTIHTDDGRIVLGLDPASDVTVDAHTSSGKISAEAPLVVTSSGDDDDAPATVRLGTGSGRLDVGSSDGSISIRAQGVERT